MAIVNDCRYEKEFTCDDNWVHEDCIRKYDGNSFFMKVVEDGEKTTDKLVNDNNEIEMTSQEVYDFSLNPLNPTIMNFDKEVAFCIKVGQKKISDWIDKQK